MQEDRRDAAETEEDGGGGDEEYEMNSKAGTGEDTKPCGDAQGMVKRRLSCEKQRFWLTLSIYKI